MKKPQPPPEVKEEPKEVKPEKLSLRHSKREDLPLPILGRGRLKDVVFVEPHARNHHDRLDSFRLRAVTTAVTLEETKDQLENVGDWNAAEGEEAFDGGYSELYGAYNAENYLFFLWEIVELTIRLLILFTLPPAAQAYSTVALMAISLAILLKRRPHNEVEVKRNAIVVKTLQFTNFFILIIGPDVGMGSGEVSSYSLLIANLTMGYLVINSQLMLPFKLIDFFSTKVGYLVKAYKKFKKARALAAKVRKERLQQGLDVDEHGCCASFWHLFAMTVFGLDTYAAEMQERRRKEMAIVYLQAWIRGHAARKAVEEARAAMVADYQAQTFEPRKQEPEYMAWLPLSEIDVDIGGDGRGSPSRSLIA